MSTNPEAKSKSNNETKIILNEALYEKFIYGLSFTSFTAGLAASIWFTRRKGNLRKTKSQLPLQSTLETKFTEDSMKEARLFALQTFGLGTLLCCSVFGSVIYGVSRATGASDLKEFSGMMKALLSSKRKGNVNPLASTPSTSQDPTV